MSIKFLRLKLTVVFVGGIISVIPFAYHLAYLNKIYPGVKVAGIYLGNKTKNEAIAILQEEVSQRKPEKINITTTNKTWDINLEDLELSYDTQLSVTLAFQIGRKGDIVFASKEKWQAWKNNINLPLEISLNKTILQRELEEISFSVFIPAVDPQIKIIEKGVIIDPGQDGQELDIHSLQESIFFNLSSLSSLPITASIIYTSPKLTPEIIERTKNRAENFLDKTITLTFEDKPLTLNAKELINLISFWDGFDQEKITSVAANLASGFNRPAQNASFKFEDGKVAVFRPDRDGIKVNEEKLKNELSTSLERLEQEEPKEEILTIPFEKISPQIKTADVNNLGIKELLGKGESFFRGSIPSRIHNIVLASSKLNGLLVAPGEDFSFNQSLGEVSQTTGFKEAYIIKEGRTILGDGGGVCQVSTTLFRAVLNAGLPIEERHPHAYRVSYYEQNSSVGLDATVFDPTADFKFKNDTAAYILIQSQVDTKAKYLVFMLYGLWDGRIVTLGKPKIWDQIPPPPDLFQDDPTLPAGQIKQVDWKAWGAKVAFGWKVTRDSQILQDRTFYSAYRPWQAIFLRGTSAAQ